MERGQAHKSKKRHRKELSAAIRAEVVRLYVEEHVLQREIAKKYRISERLVSQLVVEAERFPEK